MDRLLSFDIAAIIIFGILIFSIFFRGMYRGKENVVFLIFLGVSFVCSLFSFVKSYAVKYPENINVTFRYFCHTGYLLFRGLITPLYAVYIVALTDTWHKIKNNKTVGILLVLPIILLMTGLLINPFNHALFYINADLQYVRGDWFVGVYVCGMVYVVAIIWELAMYKKLLSRDKLIFLSMIIPFSMMAVIVQYIYPNVTIEMFATSVAALMMTITVQRPEDSIDSLTGIRKFSAYTTDIKKWFMNGKPIEIVLINVSNYGTLYSMMGYDNIADMLKTITRELRKINNDLKCRARLYYLDSGRFRCVLEQKYFDYTENIAKQINRVLKNGVRVNDMDINLIGYVSIVKCPEDICEFESLMHYGSDISKIVPYSGEIIYAKDIVNSPKYFLQNDMNKIIEGGLTKHRFEVYYQPIFSLKRKKFTSAEALLRLRDEDGNFISPELFIPAAEKNGTIHMIGDYVMEEVCKFIDSAAFRDTGVEYIEVNLSVSQCMQSGLAERILATMRKYNVAPSQINLEITETSAIYAQNKMMENLEKLSQAGVTFSLDDYGTGYSNIQRVASLPLKIVKLDKSFADMQNNPRMWIILRNTVKMLKDMDMEIVVEGVETAQMVQRFAELDCEYIQGYYYSKPVPKPDFISFICDDEVYSKNKA